MVEHIWTIAILLWFVENILIHFVSTIVNCQLAVKFLSIQK